MKRMIFHDKIHSFLLFFCSFLIVAFGQPAWEPFLAVMSSICGYALFFKLLLKTTQVRPRFWLGFSWFSLVQAVQLTWLLSHPFAYIYGLYLFLVTAIGIQFGLLSILVTKERVLRWTSILGLSGFWVLMEWLRLFFLSGFPFNPAGLALTGNIYGLQLASLGGVYFLTFIVLLTNFSLLKLSLNFSLKKILPVLLLVMGPYLFGFTQIKIHEPYIQKSPQLKALLIQTAFPIEETIPFQSFNEAVNYVVEEWKNIFIILHDKKQKVDLIVLPEYVVPYGTYMAIYTYHEIESLFLSIFGQDKKNLLPALEEPLAREVELNGIKQWRVSNGYICQALANLWDADVIVGLQDDQWVSANEMRSYSSAFYFWPQGKKGLRYDKQVLLPMAEYIPLECARQMAKEYGISGSFTCGNCAKIFPGKIAPYGLSICYEEIFGNLMRQNRVKGAEILVNVTSDIWYPNSKLPKQHLDHAKLRTVEMGIPLLRACNTGITSSFNSLGQEIDSLGEEAEWQRTSLYTQIPLYHYQTLYTLYGDIMIVSLSWLFSFFLYKKS